MYAFLVAPLLLAQCKVAGVYLVGQRSVHFPFTSIIADRRLLDACMGMRESREDARETKRKVWMENRERATKGREGEIAVRWTADWVRKKGKGDGVTQMIDGRMLRQNKVSDRHGEERRRQEGRHMLLVICPIIKNLIYWQASTLSLSFSTSPAPSDSPMSPSLPILPSLFYLLWIEMSDSCYRGNQRRCEAGHFW